MVVPPSECVPGLLATIRSFFVGQDHGVLRSVQLVHRGLSAKVVEFSVNYGVMGFTACTTYHVHVRGAAPADGRKARQRQVKIKLRAMRCY